MALRCCRRHQSRQSTDPSVHSFVVGVERVVCQVVRTARLQPCAGKHDLSLIHTLLRRIVAKCHLPQGQCQEQPDESHAARQDTGEHNLDGIRQQYSRDDQRGIKCHESHGHTRRATLAFAPALYPEGGKPQQHQQP
jgi:hypothetical protein